ncbi:hypothetical protein OESDEN_02317 [Oesophagostomum dentatum]|uniref:Uncharacterized protein n=1 Tax=Oesophagostomum dentatum TaxID=61180 RepID=A0A0B1TJJ4_OESDE|nr:hypothetical protein OESDEN_02317 [Oesophagostomum dentatum]
MAVQYKRYIFLILFQGVLNISPPPPPQKLKSRYYELDAEKLKDLWHNAMIRGLIKARAKELLSNLPHIEQVVYQQCEKDAKTTVALAKCAIRVFDARDNAREEEKKQRRPVMALTVTAFRKPDVSLSPLLGFNPQLKKNQFYSKYSGKFANPIRRQLRKNVIKIPSTDEVANIRRGGLMMENAEQIPMRPRRRRKRRSLEDEISDGYSANFQGVVAKYLRKAFGESRGPSHLKNLRIIRDHFERVEKINSYFKYMNENNRRLFERVALPIDSRTPEITNNAVPALEQVLDMVNTFAASQSASDKLSVLSPRVFSLFPESSRSSKRLLSPTFFSFQKDGFLSLPELFDIITTNQKYQQLMVDIVMDISGAGAVLEKLVADMGPEIDELKNVKLPLIEKLSKKDQDWEMVHESFDEEQTSHFNGKGYAFLTKDQLDLIYSKEEQALYGMNTTKLGMMSEAEKMERLENDIRAMAALERPKWPMWDAGRHSVVKRQTEGTGTNTEHTAGVEGSHGEEEERINGVVYETLRPYAFTTLLGRGGAVEAVTLSPHAFVSEIASPEALVLQTLSPRAFVASILSPNALIARILSPTALRGEVLSPRALHTWILSPEALVAEVLSPRFMDPRVLSPEALVIDVLSPGFLSPHVLSSESIGLIILSPNILSPRIASEERLLVEVLSPHILGGPHTHEEASHEVVEVGAHSPTRESTELEHEEHEAIHRGHSREEAEEERSGEQREEGRFGRI